ncbi:MAG TPA: flavodoxin-dependent (E)-4-hydroxy-3-methylbut-2-enyl-diphosphate synthase [Fervidobacterium sp.]|nr:4-hydroxy-3-methylbut-2-en-1-yl diphosphate synthase [Fervidobacterium sp.]HOM74576.1 flavodoxin-dependent (E)-4-hydroxy-3-methylbut-2-enyl-diphosphate synthase [Fervidobacterium sp.]HOQ40191.1 flavodoxin-dependent (E)-4-hydroxy-3-methylbut-2-enyl-diphosphate synthase [Fervidobacterium sp.]HPT54332.1 flavodoxin-dependent (E)-4-hydroxy-3-methylbut-2-enyl-diphosphate synthase [Fervidobacterium sp.]HPZ18151.1 flavodoxin-dependent (E)-4-hydroxy-3-methylbut-2-enyl-diphosphate synthase [Fervidobac
MRASKMVKVGDISIGGGNPIVIQSMTNTDTRDVEKTVEQINNLVRTGCEIVRVSLPDLECAKKVKEIKERISVPLVGDIHFDYRIAIESIKNGIDKIRINPGNIRDPSKVLEIVKIAKERSVPIRVGANTGSLPKDLEHLPREQALGEAALREVKLLEKHGFNDIVISVKSSDAIETIQANRYVAKQVDYPLHVGVTEAGTIYNSLIKSSIALSTLIMDGLVDTLRISISGNPVNEVISARKLLTFLHLREGPDVVACPTCARSVFDVEKVALAIEEKIAKIDKKITVSVLGCIVNGIGEGKEADVGIAGTKGGVVLFYKGQIVGTYPYEEGINKLEEYVKELTK